MKKDIEDIKVLYKREHRKDLIKSKILLIISSLAVVGSCIVSIPTFYIYLILVYTVLLYIILNYLDAIFDRTNKIISLKDILYIIDINEKEFDSEEEYLKIRIFFLEELSQLLEVTSILNSVGLLND